MFRILFFVLVPFVVYAADNAEIFGSAQTASGKPVKAEFSFPEENVEILPVVEEKPAPTEENTPKKVMNVPRTNEIHQLSPQDPKPFSISPQAEKNEIENTLYEGGDRIYDVQSFPLKDIKIITTPNIDPTISTYPEY